MAKNLHPVSPATLHTLHEAVHAIFLSGNHGEPLIDAFRAVDQFQRMAEADGLIYPEIEDVVAAEANRLPIPTIDAA